MRRTIERALDTALAENAELWQELDKLQEDHQDELMTIRAQLESGIVSVFALCD